MHKTRDRAMPLPKQKEPCKTDKSMHQGKIVTPDRNPGSLKASMLFQIDVGLHIGKAIPSTRTENMER